MCSGVTNGGLLICLAGHQLAKNFLDSDQVIHVLSGTDIIVNQSELVCITGQSGCGKSTLLHILGLLDAPDSGTIELFGKEINSNSPDAAHIRNRDMGFVFQFHYLIEDLNAQENVAIPAMIAGESRQKSMNRATEILHLFDMDHRIGHYPNQLSGGEQQRVSLARALINNPKIVFADEPTGNLDPQHSLEVWQNIQKLNQDFGYTFVIVTHDSELANSSPIRYELKNGILVRNN
jgi:lipoprotein-releasing system ATP-binding protein